MGHALVMLSDTWVKRVTWVRCRHMALPADDVSLPLVPVVVRFNRTGFQNALQAAWCYLRLFSTASISQVGSAEDAATHHAQLESVGAPTRMGGWVGGVAVALIPDRAFLCLPGLDRICNLFRLKAGSSSCVASGSHPGQ